MPSLPKPNESGSQKRARLEGVGLAAGPANVIETDERAGEFKRAVLLRETKNRYAVKRDDSL